MARLNLGAHAGNAIEPKWWQFSNKSSAVSVRPHYALPAGHVLCESSDGHVPRFEPFTHVFEPTSLRHLRPLKDAMDMPASDPLAIDALLRFRAERRNWKVTVRVWVVGLAIAIFAVWAMSGAVTLILYPIMDIGLTRRDLLPACGGLLFAGLIASLWWLSRPRAFLAPGGLAFVADWPFKRKCSLTYFTVADSVLVVSRARIYLYRSDGKQAGAELSAHGVEVVVRAWLGAQEPLPVRRLEQYVGIPVEAVVAR
jgi:hypothetical protein